MRKADYRSPEAAEYRKLYRSPRWLKDRALFLKLNPHCGRCKELQGKLVDAEAVHHRTPHKGDERLFFDWSNWRALCKPCHDGPVQAEERTGYLKGSVNGRPRDPNHPWNRKRL